jgi:hypothetical protein
MLTIKNINKLEGWVFRSGEYIIQRAFDYGDSYMIYIESNLNNNPTKKIVSLSRKYNNDSEQLYSLSIAGGKSIGVWYSSIENKDTFAMLIEDVIEC